MRELDKELKELRLYGMAGAWEDLAKQGGQATLESSRWLLEHLLQAEVTDRAMRSVSYQMHAPMATPNCSTVGQSNCSRQDGVIMRGLR